MTVTPRRVVRVLMMTERPATASALSRLAAQSGEFDIRVAPVDVRVLATMPGAPDVLLMETAQGAGPLQDMLRQVQRARQGLPLVMLVPREDDDHLVMAIAAGAAAYVAQDTPPEFILSMLRRVANGEDPLQYSVLRSPAAAEFLLRRVREVLPVGEAAAPCPLSRRELDVLKRVAQGYSNKAIAAQLGLQEQTIKNCVSTILRKMGANHRAQAAVEGVRNGWVTLD